MQIWHIGGRNLNILEFCYILLESLDKRFIRVYRRFIGVLQSLDNSAVIS